MLTNTSHMVYVCLSPVASVFMIAMNVVTAIVFSRKLKLKSFSNMIMLNICFCDIFVCFVSNTFYVYNLAHPRYAWSTGAIPCKAFRTFTMLANVAQIFSLCFICMDRLNRLVNPLKPQWSKKRGRATLVVIWLVAAALTIPRWFLFDQMTIQKTTQQTNLTKIVNYACKPIGLQTTEYAVLTIVLFVVAYCIPTLYITYSLIRAQIFAMKYDTAIMGGITNFTRLNRQLSRAFNLTGLLFMIIWTPFFLMSVIDLKENLIGQKDLTHLNFSMRCTLLVLGSAKPIIYFVCLEKFRNIVKRFICFSSEPTSYQPTSTMSDVMKNASTPGHLYCEKPIFDSEAAIQDTYVTEATPSSP